MEAAIEGMSVSWCTSRRCDGSIMEVTSYLQRRFGDESNVATRAGFLAVSSAAVGVVVNVHSPREYRGRLAFGGWRRRMPVTVEVAPWSADECELLVRPVRRPPNPGTAYYAAAIAVVDALADEVSSAVARPAEVRHTEPLRRAS